MLNLPNLEEVKAQVDRIDANVAEIREKIEEIHAVFQGLVSMMPMLGGGNNDAFDVSSLLR